MIKSIHITVANSIVLEYLNTETENKIKYHKQEKRIAKKYEINTKEFNLILFFLILPLNHPQLILSKYFLTEILYRKAINVFTRRTSLTG